MGIMIVERKGEVVKIVVLFIKGMKMLLKIYYIED